MALVLLGAWFLLALMQLGSFDYDTVRHWIGRPVNSILLLLLTGALAYHSLLGVQVVIEDYVHGPLKIVSLVLSKFAHVAVAAASVFAVSRIAFGIA